VIGFGDSGGSGGSLVRFLEEIVPIDGGIFWCYREKSPGSLPAKEIQHLVERHNGKVVPILGFDEMMFQFWSALKMTSGQDELDEKYHALLKEYQDGFLKLAERITALETADNSDTVKATIQSAKAALARLQEDSFS
jgi:hypothetical protein